ncbi:Protein of unknown function (DUF3109) [Prevotella dentalis DSM 3688]|uniref:Uncharacterized protein n=1 Tax=Prevotella dentalis (strain ATCC 49559 / DSM 3688 / JCM 13448 / NCTC 12043 / ES 2772) TaxID=908937 RepID=F9D3P7_PREDD|nr:DUF3109 family protein [Prevotella dentalis]AGB27484.1 Protein of unknown function (DUF3109) [Prevotella dentalis DSM 3688]EGQ14332.1 hypothetical protein HMPREF9136_1475 [Prevotella dentalis DSM 3688]
MELHILQIGDVLVSPDIFTEKFCCDLDACKGRCCVEGDAGAPVTFDEIGSIESCLDEVWPQLSASAQSVVDRQGVAYADRDGDLVTSIVNGKDCVFTCYEDLDDRTDGHTIHNCCLCALERACHDGRTSWCKPISCALYPIREKQFGGGLVGLNYHRWDICRDAVKKGRELDLRIYEFLKEPLIRRFGRAWYEELCEVGEEIRRRVSSEASS